MDWLHTRSMLALRIISDTINMKTWKEILTPKILINSIIAGGLVFAGAFTGGIITPTSFCAASAGALIAFLTQIRDQINITPKSKPIGLFAFI